MFLRQRLLRAFQQTIRTPLRTKRPLSTQNISEDAATAHYTVYLKPNQAIAKIYRDRQRLHIPNEDSRHDRLEFLPEDAPETDQEGNQRLDILFPEEPLGFDRRSTYFGGYAEMRFGDNIGPQNCYKILRKLGWGTNSNIWMALDTRTDTYVSIKIISGAASVVYGAEGPGWELPALQKLSSLPSKHCLQLLDHFAHSGQAGYGPHLCLVTPVQGGDVSQLRNVMPPNPASIHEDRDKRPIFPLPIAKRILFHALSGLAHIHSRGIVHGDLKAENIYFDHDTDIPELLADDPSRYYPEQQSVRGIVQTAVSQPMSISSIEETLTRTFCLGDLGTAQLTKAPLMDAINSQMKLRPPELLLNGPWDEKVDIWAFGCLAFEFLVGESLFHNYPLSRFNLDVTASLLWQMTAVTRQRFSSDQLNASEHSPKYFNDDCNLKGDLPDTGDSVETLVRIYNTLEEKDVAAAAKIIQKCLTLDPFERASADELLRDPWWAGVN